MSLQGVVNTPETTQIELSAREKTGLAMTVLIYNRDVLNLPN